jgi:hypothetical protein
MTDVAPRRIAEADQPGVKTPGYRQASLRDDSQAQPSAHPKKWRPANGSRSELDHCMATNKIENAPEYFK